ncbi:gustatory receptor for sugar taste 43a isoform X3 [Toxorhynchites rutilus septentrionalis]|uniref:gustatory receptor for sugar taste 43a isoform X3 n=1 Tax=Toxorhynchites rutilus septentrionalis TaxID=329112 RepID=UPI002479B7DF|nr:gustatory receptor for sugar taste 43a isoform X3 [Toxorhynchites rutilus septentrionalis]
MKSVFHFLNHAVVRNRRHTMEISESTRAVFFVSRVFGLAPYVVKKTSKGQIVDYKRNLFLVIYGLCVVFCLGGRYAFGVCQGGQTEQREAKRSHNVSFGGSHHNRSASPRHLGLVSDSAKSEKRKSRLGLHSGTFHPDNGINCSTTVFPLSIGANVLGYCPFYALYYILMMFHVLFAQSALGISSRFRHLNIALYHVLPESSKIPVIEITSASSINNVSERMDNAKEQKKGLTAISHAGHTSSIMTSNRMIEDLAYIHASLSTAVILVSNTFGVALLAVLGSCLLHLVATSYFLMVELVGDKDAVFSWIQALWLFIHIFRFLLTVEPCHLTNVESRRTMSIVCNLMRTCKDMLAKERLESFWRQLVGNNSVFTACGLCTIDRHIITSYCGAITTYLVILIQFKEADDRPIRTIYRST